MDAHEDELVNTFSQDHNDTGTITGIIKFENTKNVERDLATVIADSGYSSDTEAPNYINAGVNPLYLSSEKSTGTGTILALICILAAFLLTGYLIIYNIFQISVLRDLHFYGLLKTIGTTDRQIRSILSRQAWILSLIGIPIGLGGGFFIGKALLPLLIEQTSFPQLMQLYPLTHLFCSRGTICIAYSKDQYPKTCKNGSESFSH